MLEVLVPILVPDRDDVVVIDGDHFTLAVLVVEVLLPHLVRVRVRIRVTVLARVRVRIRVRIRVRVRARVRVRVC